MNRRHFIRETCNLCVTAIVAGWLAESCAGSGRVIQAGVNGQEVEIKASELEDNRFQVIDASGLRYRIAVRREAEGQYVALLLMCTHARNPVTLTGNGFYCPLHGSRFDDQGNVVQGPAQQPLVHLPVDMDPQGLLHIHLQPWMKES
ncbi:Rieske-like 2Fe-2S protein [Thermoflavifilum aggregans]|uniref:Rieske-like 2Fe-2S protein n=1 Tax=Thermoflavifilum aggregans TaxID=454188 RepID=A0A2M9CSU5_9BACT|nr:Rieske (2Fe-2S) protein [Thermoflavifilum aggregans]PJJ74921.1 Rieske-like 2Fe-2S protein [Thermoflavifilum aggregans]